MCGWDAEGNIVLANSTACYSKPDGVQSADSTSAAVISDTGTLNAINTLMGKVSMGFCGDTSGFAYVFKIHKDHWNTSAAKVASNWIKETESSISLDTVFASKKLKVRPEFITGKCTYVVKKNDDGTWSQVRVNNDTPSLFALSDYGSWVGGPASNIYALKNGARLWLGYLVYRYLIGGSDTDTIESNIAAIYNDNVGWAGDWKMVNFENENFALVQGTCQSESEGPVLSDGSTSLKAASSYTPVEGGNNKIAQTFPLNMILSYGGTAQHAYIRVRLGNKYWGAAALKKFFGDSIYEDSGTYAVVYDYSYDSNYLGSTKIPDSEVQKYIIPYVDVTDIRIYSESSEGLDGTLTCTRQYIAGSTLNSFALKLISD
jgi:hypothetical protein